MSQELFAQKIREACSALNDSDAEGIVIGVSCWSADDAKASMAANCTAKDFEILGACLRTNMTAESAMHLVRGLTGSMQPIPPQKH